MERSPLDRPVLVTGIPRAGKTTVRRILSAAEEFASIHEPVLTWNYGMRSRRDDRRTAEDATPDVREHIRADCLGMVQRAGKARYLDDLAYHSLRVPFSQAVMPEARIVLVVRNAEQAVPEFLHGWTNRDPVGKAFSRRRKGLRLHGLHRAALRFARNYFDSRVRGRRASWGPIPPGLHEFGKGRGVAEIAAYQWLKMTQIAMDDLEQCPPESWLLVRLDRLVADPDRELRRLIDFCEPADPDAVIRKGFEYLDPNHVSDRHVEPSEAQWAQIREIVEPMQRRLGYL